MQIFKRFALIVLGFAALSSIVACGDKGDDSSAATAGE
jgi:predicted small lipoprotein YifL